MMRTLLIVMALLSSCRIDPGDSIDYSDPEMMVAYDEVVLGISDVEDQYELRKDTITISDEELMYLYTILHNGHEVYSEVHRVRLGGRMW